MLTLRDGFPEHDSNGHALLKSAGRQLVLQSADRAWGPVALSSCESIFRSLALEIRSRFDEFPPIDVVKSVHVDYRVLRPINRARGDRHHAASQADVEICGSRPKPISLYLGGVVDLEMETAIWMGGPDGLVLCA
jgi:hypothetical protein